MRPCQRGGLQVTQFGVCNLCPRFFALGRRFLRVPYPGHPQLW